MTWDTSQALEVLKEFPEGFKGIALEVGANDGIFLSNSIQLEERGWRILCFEPNTEPAIANSLMATRKEVYQYAIADFNGTAPFYLFNHGPNWASNSGLDPGYGNPEKVLEVPVRTLTSVLEELGIERVDAIFMDIEGGELNALKGFDFKRWKPKVLIIEDYRNKSGIAEYLWIQGYERTSFLTEHDSAYKLREAVCE